MTDRGIGGVSADGNRILGGAIVGEVLGRVLERVLGRVLERVLGGRVKEAEVSGWSVKSK